MIKLEILILTSLKQLFGSFDISNEYDYGIEELQHSAYYCIDGYAIRRENIFFVGDQ